MKTFIVTSPKECIAIDDSFPDFKDYDQGIHYQNAKVKWIELNKSTRYPILSSNNYEVGEEISGTLCYQYFVCGIKGERESEWLTSDEEFCKKYFPNDYRVSVIPVQQEKPMDKLIEKMEEKNIKCSFGLTPGNIAVIEKWIAKWDGNVISEYMWNDIGKEIGWHPLTAMCWYLRDFYPHLTGYKPTDFQNRVNDWMQVCFVPEISTDLIERNHRFIEEALELVQATGATKRECHQLVDYVFNRDIGEVNQEVGGVMVTLAALCNVIGLNINDAGETELKRIWTKVEKI